MKNGGYLLATATGVAAAAAATGGAQAADMGLPAKAPYTPPPPVASWAGWYIGGSIGTAWQHVDSFAYGDGGQTSDSQSSFIGGGHVGYNWQQGNFVFGGEADFSGLTHGPRTPSNIAGKGDLLQSDIRWLATFRTREGLAIGDTMVYLTGGLAVGNVKNVLNFNGLGFPATTKSVTKTKAGWVAGGGLEHMLTPNWVVGTEVMFVDLGKSTANLQNPGHAGKTSQFKNQAVIARARLSYKF